MPWALSWLPDLLGLPCIYHKQKGHFPLINHTGEGMSVKEEVKNNGPINSHDFKI
jgi:hypothetical protein